MEDISFLPLFYSVKQTKVALQISFPTAKSQAPKSKKEKKVKKKFVETNKKRKKSVKSLLADDEVPLDRWPIASPFGRESPASVLSCLPKGALKGTSRMDKLAETTK